MKESQIMLTREDFSVILDALMLLTTHLPKGARRLQVAVLGKNISRALIEDEKRAILEEGYVKSDIPEPNFDAIPQSKKDAIVVAAAEDAIKQMDEHDKAIVMAIAANLAEKQIPSIMYGKSVPLSGLSMQVLSETRNITNPAYKTETNARIDEARKRIDEWFESMKS